MKFMKMCKRRALLLTLFGLFCLGIAIPGQAATGFEVTKVSFDPAVTGQQFISLNKLNQDLIVSWTAPLSDALVMNYLLKFTASQAVLTDQQFNDTINDFVVSKSQQFKIILKSFFNNWDASQLQYLHIKTQYVPGIYSDDVVIGPIRVDNMAPTGTITLVPTSGTSNQVNVSLTPSEQIKYYWLSASTIFPGGVGNDYTLFPSAVFGLPLNTVYGSVNINAWFEDLAGNRSTAASAVATYTYNPPVSIISNAIQLNVGESLVFTVDNSTLCNWTLTPSATGVAEFSGGGGLTVSNVAFATVVGKAAGTFTLSATPAGGGAIITSGTIMVVRASRLLTGLNIISLSRTETGWTKAAHLITAIGTSCQSVTKWDASKQGFVTYNKALPIPALNFDLVAGDAYFVNVTGAVPSFTVTGQTITRTYSLVSGLNLLGFPESKSSITKAAALITAVGPSCQSVTKWDASKQGFVTYNKSLPIPSLNFDIAVDEGYFLNVNANTLWQ